MNSHNTAELEELVQMVKADDQAAFCELFHTHLDLMKRFAESIFCDPTSAGNIAAESFFFYWLKRKELYSSKDMLLFLYRTVRDTAAAYLVHRQGSGEKSPYQLTDAWMAAGGLDDSTVAYCKMRLQQYLTEQ